jgi:hypothetical protein
MSAHETHDDLHARLAAVVEGTGLDLDLLVDGSRRDGRRIRTRRRLTAAAACAAVAAVIVGSGFALTGRGGSTADAPYATSTGTPEPTTAEPTTAEPTTAERTTSELVHPVGRPTPITGRSTAAALLDLVGQLEDGSASGIGGQGGEPAGAPDETYAAFRWKPATGGAATPVMINVQNGFDPGPDQGAEPKGYACEEGQSVEAGTCTEVGGSGKPFFSCRDDRVACTVTREDGLLVVAYEVHRGGAVDRHVDVFHPDTGLRVVVASTNASEFETRDQVRADPPLSSEELRAVATLDVWGPTLPRLWQRRGDELAPYHDYDAVGR